MHTTYNVALVSLSILIAIAGSFTALDLASRSKVATGWARHAWLAAAAACIHWPSPSIRNPLCMR